MDEQAAEGSHPADKPDNQAEQKRLRWRYVFDWGFWVAHPMATVTFFLGGLFLSPLFTFPGGNPRHLWYVAIGAWIMLAVVIGWVTASVVARLEGRELLTQQEIQDREQTYRSGIDKRLQSLEVGVHDAQSQITELRPRRLTASQRAAIRSAITPFKDQQVWAMCMINDSEAGGFAGDFSAVFRDAGWKFLGTKGFHAPSDSVSVVVSDQIPPGIDNAPPAAVAILRVLLSEGIATDTTLYKAGALTPEEIGVCIPHKPLEAAQPPSNGN